MAAETVHPAKCIILYLDAALQVVIEGSEAPRRPVNRNPVEVSKSTQSNSDIPARKRRSVGSDPGYSAVGASMSRSTSRHNNEAPVPTAPKLASSRAKKRPRRTPEEYEALAATREPKKSSGTGTPQELWAALGRWPAQRSPAASRCLNWTPPGPSLLGKEVTSLAV